MFTELKTWSRDVAVACIDSSPKSDPRNSVLNTPRDRGQCEAHQIPTKEQSVFVSQNNDNQDTLGCFDLPTFFF